MRLLAFAIASGLLALTASGCLDPRADDDPGARSVEGHLVDRLAAQVPPLAWDGDAAVAWWEDFVVSYPKRDTYLPPNDPATLHIVDSLEALGLQVTLTHHPARAPLAGTPLPDEAPLSIHTIAAYKPGRTQPDHAIALGAHYDTQTGTIQGAYDNGSGTAMVFDLCKQLASVPMDKSLLCLFFDGEELGALGSQAYLEDLPEGHPQIDVYLGYDMVGMDWPGYPAWKAYTWIGEEFAAELFPFVNRTVHGVLGFPAEGAEVFDFNDRNSDEAIFAEAGIPTLRFAGGRRAGDYDQYHLPDDTAGHVYTVVGGRENFKAGFGTLVQESYTLALMLDQTSLEELRSDSA
ncbi:MAG TPA: M28 family peptidase [Candidatus Thermoplasmatota archaeon]|nr:M28 family peptidase [Candidatus Thermoplasmatota archaeon]